MSHLKVTIDGETVMDGDATSWQDRPPEFIAQQLANMSSSGTPAPYMRALMLVIAEAAMTKTYTDATVVSSGGGWNLAVKYALELE